MTDPESPGAQQQEPPWPTWEHRDDRWDLVEYGLGVCGCRLLDVTFEDATLFGGVAYRLARCVDCRAVWEDLSQRNRPPLS